MLPKSKLATFALIVIAKERTAETYPMREESQNNERKNMKGRSILSHRSECLIQTLKLKPESYATPFFF
jgi:hypothetical protein